MSGHYSRVPHLRDGSIVAKVGGAPLLHPDIHKAVILSEARSAESISNEAVILSGARSAESKNPRISLFTPPPVSTEATR